MNIRKSVIDGQILDVYKYDEYAKNPQAYDGNCAILEDGYIYPIRKLNDNRPGMYTAGPRGTMVVFEKPVTDEQQQMYSDSNLIDFSGNTMSQMIENTEILFEKEKEILTNVNNIFSPKVKPEDTATMAGLKESITEKNCDFGSYKHRFGNNYNNTLKLFENNDITLKKVGYICEKLDIKVSLVLEDADPNVANPMGTTIVKVITGAED